MGIVLPYWFQLLSALELLEHNNNMYECIQCSKAREQIFQFWKLLAVMLDTHIKCVCKVHKSNDPTLMFPLI